jgi:hypothetical protein
MYGQARGLAGLAMNAEPAEEPSLDELPQWMTHYRLEVSPDFVRKIGCSAATTQPAARLRLNTPPGYFERFEKMELLELANRLLEQDPIAIELCVAFFEVETSGIWHNRARAMIARRLKHCRLSKDQRTGLVRVILDRLSSGRFAQQFKDQLRLAIQLEPNRVRAVASTCQDAAPDHVRRYAAWVLSPTGSDVVRRT